MKGAALFARIFYMRVYFIRHGEAMDDVNNEYGGWADAELSPKGREEVAERAEDLAKRGINASIIYSSPLQRAKQSAEIIAEKPNLPIEELVYLKERNTYGLLCGVNKELAEEKYPELVAAYKADEEVLGYEEYSFFVKRVKALIERLAKLPHQEVLAITHGKLLKALLEDIIGGNKVTHIIKAALVVVEIDSKGNLKLIETDGVEFE